jgi:4a-hydroxytetrahydrobiopterin dehydratase
MAKLSVAEAEQRLRSVHGWRLEGNQITKQFTFAGFPEAVRFVSSLVPEAEAADHHPDILISYKRVTLTYSTHSEGGLTDKDFAGAAMADRVADAAQKNL